MFRRIFGYSVNEDHCGFVFFSSPSYCYLEVFFEIQMQPNMVEVFVTLLICVFGATPLVYCANFYFYYDAYLPYHL